VLPKIRANKFLSTAAKWRKTETRNNMAVSPYRRELKLKFEPISSKAETATGFKNHNDPVLDADS
jgi:hypothetical protein